MKPNIGTERTIERDGELLIWSTSEESARRFFGLPSDVPCRVVKDSPTTTAEREKYSSAAKLYGLDISKQLA